jgi:hypothetical protein
MPTRSASVLRVADRIIHAMAYKRNDFKNKVEEYTGGALLEFYKARLAAKNGQTQWVRHWMTEVHGLLDRSLVAALVHEIRGFTDRHKAAEEVFVAMRAKDASYRMIAERVILKDYRLKKVRAHLDDSDTEAFWERVRAAVTIALD